MKSPGLSFFRKRLNLMEVRRTVDLYLNSFGGLFFSLALLTLYFVRYQQATVTYPPRGTGNYLLELSSKEAYTVDSSQHYRLGFRLLEEPEIQLFSRSDDSLWQNIWPGAKLYIQGEWQALPKGHSLQSFDYGLYLFHEGFKGYLQIERLRPLDKAGLSPSKPYRQYVIDKIDTWPWTEDQKGIFKALMVGDKGGLSRELKKEFGAAGAMHFLALSGLHVGVLYLLLNFVLRLFRLQKWPWLEFLLINSALWSFALFSGAAPSVLRAVSMFGFIALGRLSRRPQGGLRALIFSAFIFLGLNPLLIHSVGFQLSYLALLGILLFMPKLEQIWRPRSALAFKFLQLNYLSLSAQVFTWPLTISYFGQFPLYFALTSLLLMPLISIIMYGGILCLSLSELPLVGEYILERYPLSLNALQEVVAFIEGLDYSTIQGLSLSGANLLLFLLLPFAFIVTLKWRLPYLGLLLVLFGYYKLSLRIMEPPWQLRDHGPKPPIKELRIAEQHYYFHELIEAQLKQKQDYWDKLDKEAIFIHIHQRYVDSLIQWDRQGLRIAPKKAP